MSSILDKFSHWVNNRHDYVKNWKKERGGKAVGYFCSYLPEEIFYAANILPVRIFGGHEASNLVESHISTNIACAFCRDCLGQGLTGKYDYIDGLTMAQTCLHTGQIFWIWSQEKKLEWTRFIAIPHGTQNVGRFEYLMEEMKLLKSSIENWTGKSISDEELDRSIEIHNLNRKLCRQVYEYRKKDNPPVTGEDALNIILSSQMVDKNEHNQALQELLNELPTMDRKRQTGTRLMLIGSVNDDIRFMKMVENELNLPATFVIEDTCTGLRYFYNDVTPQKDKLMALSIRYNHRPPCPLKDWPARRRFPYIFNIFKQYNAQAVILMNQKWCSPHITDNVPLEKKFREQGVTTARIEFDITIPMGQHKTLLEATLETMVEFV